MERETPPGRTIVAYDGTATGTDFGKVLMPDAFTASSANTRGDSLIPAEYVVGSGERFDQLRADRDDLTTRITMLETAVGRR